MAIKALNLAATRKYTSVFDNGPEDEKTIFVIGSLDSRLMGMIKDKATKFSVDPSNPNDNVDTQVNAEQVAFNAVLYGLKGIEGAGLHDAGGNPVKVEFEKRTHGGTSYRVIAASVVEQIPNAILKELAEEIMKDNELSKDEAKN